MFNASLHKSRQEVLYALIKLPLVSTHFPHETAILAELTQSQIRSLGRLRPESDLQILKLYKDIYILQQANLKLLVGADYPIYLPNFDLVTGNETVSFSETSSTEQQEIFHEQKPVRQAPPTSFSNNPFKMYPTTPRELAVKEIEADLKKCIAAESDVLPPNKFPTSDFSAQPTHLSWSSVSGFWKNRQVSTIALIHQSIKAITEDGVPPIASIARDWGMHDSTLRKRLAYVKKNHSQEGECQQLQFEDFKLSPGELSTLLGESVYKGELPKAMGPEIKAMQTLQYIYNVKQYYAKHFKRAPGCRTLANRLGLESHELEYHLASFIDPNTDQPLIWENFKNYTVEELDAFPKESPSADEDVQRARKKRRSHNSSIWKEPSEDLTEKTTLPDFSFRGAFAVLSK